MSVRAAAEGGDACAVTVDPTATVASLIAAVHAALGLPGAVSDYDYVRVGGGDGGVGGGVVLNGTSATAEADVDAAYEATRLLDIGMLCIDDAVDVRARPHVVARARLAALWDMPMASVTPGLASQRTLMLLDEDVLAHATREAPHRSDDDGDSHAGAPRSEVVLEGHVDTIQLIRQSNLIPSVHCEGIIQRALEQAVAEGCPHLARLALQCGAPPNGTMDFAGGDSMPLLMAALYDDASSTTCAAIVDALLKAGADPNCVHDGNGDTPLIRAASRHTAAETAALLAHGAAVDARNRAGRQALHVAAAVGNVDAARVLIAAGAPVDEKDARGYRPLTLACWHGHMHVRFVLEAAGAVRYDGGAWDGLVETLIDAREEDPGSGDGGGGSEDALLA